MTRLCMHEKREIRTDEPQQTIVYSKLPNFNEAGNIVDAPPSSTLAPSVTNDALAVAKDLRGMIYGPIASMVIPPPKTEAQSTEYAQDPELAESAMSSNIDDLDSNSSSDTDNRPILPINTESTSGTQESLAEVLSTSTYERKKMPSDQDDGSVYHKLSAATTSRANLSIDAFIKACQQGNLADLERLFLKPTGLPDSPHSEHLITYQGELLFAKDGQAFIEAASNNHPEVMTMLLSKCTSTATLVHIIRTQNDAAFKNAFKNGYATALKVILHEIFNLHKKDKSVFQELTGSAFRAAVSNHEFAKLALLVDSSPTPEAAALMIHDNDDIAFVEVAMHKHLDSMKWLLDKADPSSHYKMFEHALLKVLQERHIDGLVTLINMMPDYITDVKVKHQLINFCITNCANQVRELRYDLAELLHNNLVTKTLFPNIHDAFIAASEHSQVFVMDILLNMSSGEAYRGSMLKIAFNNTCRRGNDKELTELLALFPDSSEEREQLIHANNDAAFQEASRDGRVNTMQVLKAFTPTRSTQNAMLQAASYKPWESAIAKDQVAVLEFYLEHYTQTSDLVTFNQMIDEGSTLAKKGNKEPFLRLLGDFVATISSEDFFKASWKRAVECDQLNVLRFYCEQSEARKEGKYHFAMIKKFYPFAYSNNKTDALDLFLEFFDDKTGLRNLIKELQNELVINHNRDYLNPDITWKAGKRLRELKEAGYNFEKVGELLSFASAVHREYGKNKFEKCKDGQSIPYQSATILSAADKDIVFGVLTTPIHSVSQRLSQLTIRRSSDRPPLQLTMSVSNLEERTNFYKAIVARLPAISSNSAQAEQRG
jgi:hypothetical protein